jgi:predicted nucleotidyltransferase
MGVFIEPPENVCGLEPCEHYVYRDQPEGVRSQPGDLDLTMYSLRKFCRLAAQGNPSVILLLWLPKHIHKTEIGAALVQMREAFISMESGARFLGYLSAQKSKLMGLRSHTVNRPELVAKYGYDTKFAMHSLRLGYEGIELMEQRRLTLPVPEPNLATLRAVRTGKVGFAEALALIDDAESRLRTLVDTCSWSADVASIDRFMVWAHIEYWKLHGLSPPGGNAGRAICGLVPAVHRT